MSDLFWDYKKSERKKYSLGIQLDEQMDSSQNTIDKFLEHKKKKDELSQIVSEWKKENGY